MILVLLLWSCSGTEALDTGKETGLLPQGDGLDELAPELLPQGESACREPELVELESVVDGDTAWFTSGSGSELVRFIGIDTPERGWDDEPSECYAEEATARVEELLVGGRAWLSFDAECEDHYERTLAYVHVGLGDQSFVQRALLQGGYATVFSVEPNTTFASSFTTDESQAQGGSMGLWGSCAR